MFYEAPATAAERDELVTALEGTYRGAILRRDLTRANQVRMNITYLEGIAY